MSEVETVANNLERIVRLMKRYPERASDNQRAYLSLYPELARLREALDEFFKK